MTRATRVTCNRCAKSDMLTEQSESAWFQIETGSAPDGRKWHGDLCTSCYDLLTEFLADPSQKTIPSGPLRCRKRMSITTSERRRIGELWKAGSTGQTIADEIGCSAARIYQIVKEDGLPGHQRGRQRSPGTKRFFPSGGTNRRHITPNTSFSKRLDDDHAAIRENRTLYPSTVTDAESSPRLLVSGHNQRKIGKAVTKGRWKGMPIYCLTLEERATCPTSCEVWNDCYGNNMHMARRHRHGPMLEDRLQLELAAMQKKHPRGFVVRLHILGDFYSENYVDLWSWALKRFPALHVFGFTAHPLGDPIGDAIMKLNLEHVLRCRIRYSGSGGTGGMAASVIDDPAEKGEAVICPAQTHATDCCGTCGLCWTMNHAVAFLRHGEATATYGG